MPRAGRRRRGAQAPAAGPSLPSRVQRLLEGFYDIEAPPVDAFLRRAEEGQREVVLVREHDGALELSVCLPEALHGRRSAPDLDALCQVIEGVSHFLYLAERARRELPVTQLELELQAEVDKYVACVLAGVYGRAAPTPAAHARAAELRSRLYDQVAFMHAEHSEHGERYRLANGLAARLTHRLETRLAHAGRFAELHATLRSFHRAGQREKLELARAA